ncbi:hypothetical protein HanXRQr2_Chr07g0292831 [Helianthus annuus]|uniref:Uncharacterized protein n=1 Tax=Helianthus annuus TaxID=4232 RepID=A0A9K3IKY4_HELAN|nr:hypothetical protein HanXRQr2_Chr07g0292831 [Helianthus annuus]KAJ0904552.1 hypothetical protein HanPSC8_Chr07g0283561 [Helianthus annuus]
MFSPTTLINKLFSPLTKTLNSFNSRDLLVLSTFRTRCSARVSK